MVAVVLVAKSEVAIWIAYKRMIVEALEKNQWFRFRCTKETIKRGRNDDEWTSECKCN